MRDIIIFEKPTCTTCRKTIKKLTEKGIDFNRVNYYLQPFTKNKLKILLKKMNMNPSGLLRKNDPAYKKKFSGNKKYSEAEILDMMIKNPDLIQRPIIEIGEKAVLARPIEKVDTLIK